jgi:predicted dehydrogenase
LLVVAFPGSLSPAVHKAKELIRAGAIGRVAVVSAFAHQAWKKNTTGKWRQVPELSGGGFLFDTGSHMVNTVVDLLSEDVTQVSAILDNRGTPVEINSSVSGQTASGVIFSLGGAGDSIQCTSLITVCGDQGVIETGIWGERLRIKTLAKPEFEDVPLPKSSGAWEQFLKVRSGKLANPCPPEVGLRFAKLMDMIRESAATGRTVEVRGRR